MKLMCKNENDRKIVHKPVEHYNLEINNNQNGEKWNQRRRVRKHFFMVHYYYSCGGNDKRQAMRWWQQRDAINYKKGRPNWNEIYLKATENWVARDVKVVTVRIQDWYSWLSAYMYSLSKERKQQDAMPAVKWWFYS